MIDVGLKNLQIDVPHAYYGTCRYFMPNGMGRWLSKLGLKYNMSYQSSWGNGCDENGKSTYTTHYSVKVCRQEDALAFRIQFPHCTVHIFD